MNKFFSILTVLQILSTMAHSQTIGAGGKLSFEDSLGFSPLHSWISIPNQETNVWQVAVPSKEFFNAAKTGDTAIITTPLGSYPENCNDFFYITLPWAEHFWGEGILSFYHKYDTDSLLDGGVIEMSYNKGSSWINILDDTNHISIYFSGLYEDTLSGGDHGYSGNSGDWKYVELYWHWIALVKKKTEFENLEAPMIRFRFKSDANNTNKEGWMIDDIVFRGYDVVDGVEEPESKLICVYPNPCVETLFIKTGKEAEGKLNFQLYDLKGHLLMNHEIENQQVNLKKLAPGQYFYKIIRQNNSNHSGKILKL